MAINRDSQIVSPDIFKEMAKGFSALIVTNVF